MVPGVGSYVWLPCEVRPGPFPNERMIRVRGLGGEWVGFVDTGLLREPVEEGDTKVRALVLQVAGDRVRAQILGEPLGATLVEEQARRVEIA